MYEERPNKIKLEELLSRLADELENSDFIANSNSPTIDIKLNCIATNFQAKFFINLSNVNETSQKK